MEEVRTYLAAAGLLAATMGCALDPATAQDAQPAATTATAPAKPAPVADTENQQPSGVGDIVVTAMRRSENLQKVPLAVTALTAAKLELSGITSTMELANQTPGLVITQQAGGASFFIRGVGSLDASAGQEASVATFVDGVYISSAYGSMFSLDNIARVEVLKGPQGTLFGRNATGGIIQVITKTPQHETQGDWTISYGNYQTVENKFYGTTGLTEKVAADLSLLYHHQNEGFGTNLTTGAPRDRTDEFAARTKFLIQPTDNTDITLTGGYFNAAYHGKGNGRQLYPGSFALDGQTTYTGHFYDIEGDINANTAAKTWDVSGQWVQRFDAFSVKSITAYRKLRVIEPFDNDFSPSAIINVDIDAQRYTTFTQEIQLLSDPASNIKWIAGAFYMNDKSGYGGPIGLSLYGSGVGPTGVSIQNSIRTHSYSGFGEATVPITDRLSVTGGLRYTSDRRAVGGNTVIFPNFSDFTPLLTIPTTPQSKTFSKLTYRGILDYKLTNNVMVYGSYSRGFKAGNFNAASPGDPAFKPEVLDAVEVGVKSDLFDRRLRLNISGYHYNYKDIQLPVTNGPTISTINATSAKIWGAEASGTVKLARDFDVDFGMNYIHATFGNFPNAPCFMSSGQGAAGQCGNVPVSDCATVASDATSVQYSCNLAGNRLPQTPRFTFDLAPVYSSSFGFGKISASAGWSYKSSFFWEGQNTLKQKSYSLVTGQLSWTDPTGKLRIRGFGKNLLNKKYVLYASSGLNGDGFSAAEPRTYGIELGYFF
jgi:iron complex outermembrane receptor protein